MAKETQIWKLIKINGNITNYEVSSDGFVRNIKTNTILLGSRDSRGYKVVSIWVDGKMYTKKVHRLVAIAFIPNPENKPTVNHKDGNKDHNYVSNLEWATHKENIDHAIQTGLRNINGVNSVSNIYDEETVRKVCKMLERGCGPKLISESLGVDVNLPNRIKYGNKWKEISSQYNIPRARKISYNTKREAFRLMSEGVMDTDELLKRLNLSDTEVSRRYIYGIRWRYRSRASSTIEHSDVGEIPTSTSK